MTDKGKRRLNTGLNICMTLFFLVCVGLLLYPYISNHFRYVQQQETIVEYNCAVREMDAQHKVDLLTAARAYNARLVQNRIGYTLSEEQMREYGSLLQVDDSGVMGHIRIPRIDVSLLIYHGVGDAVLQTGVGHLPGSSLPVGGEGVNTILMGHSGLTSATLFTNLDRLAVGDTFTLTVLDDVLTYEIDCVEVVEPWAVHELSVDPQQDYCTLITCTPYGVNSHRLVVRGRRVPTPEKPETLRRGFYTILTPAPDGGLDLSQKLALAGVAVLVGGAVFLLCNIHHKRKKECRHGE